MHFGLVMECEYRYGSTLEESFQDVFDLAKESEEGGLDGVWLAERHFAAPRDPLDAQGGGIPSIVSVPLIMATAIAARTERLRVGIAVNVLPLVHPIRMAEEAATVDQISQGRFDFGVGRSGFPRSYEGYGIPYAESRERFQECLEVIEAAWSNERFSHQGKYFTFNDLCVLPKPYQKPYPPVRVAVTTSESFPREGAAGHNIFVGLRGMDRPQVAQNLAVYRQARKDAGHTGDGDVLLRIPIYVAETDQQAHGAIREEKSNRGHGKQRPAAAMLEVDEWGKPSACEHRRVRHSGASEVKRQSGQATRPRQRHAAYSSTCSSAQAGAGSGSRSFSPSSLAPALPGVARGCSLASPGCSKRGEKLSSGKADCSSSRTHTRWASSHYLPFSQALMAAL